MEKKLIDGTVAASENNFQTNPYSYIRLGEMYLIAAEACIELNQLEEAATYLDALRSRIGRPDTKSTLAVRSQSFTQSDMREFLRQERRVELAYEESRYYDIRRWMTAPESGNKPLLGIAVVGRLKPGKTATLPYVRDENTWDYTYTVLDLSYIEKRRWDNKMYFAPIKREEIRRNPAMIQNPGMD
ncbi:MAG: RagB/SusD family nutrient uptake outer membrane protein [Tannerellaceae bacterium]|nr:RagB/SusD family nutrient uptake outer membrane protein [Tannerellaceae bacterium]